MGFAAGAPPRGGVLMARLVGRKRLGVGSARPASGWARLHAAACAETSSVPCLVP